MRSQPAWQLEVTPQEMMLASGTELPRPAMPTEATSFESKERRSSQRAQGKLGSSGKVASSRHSGSMPSRSEIAAARGDLDVRSNRQVNVASEEWARSGSPAQKSRTCTQRPNWQVERRRAS